MNNDLISREALKKEFGSDEWYKGRTVCAIIDNAPTVEYTFEEAFQKTVCEQKLYCPKRPQGEWIDEGQYAENYGEHAYRCKECGYHIITHPNMLFENRYCKNCGAKMKDEEE